MILVTSKIKMSETSKVTIFKNIFKEHLHSSGEVTWCNSYPEDYEKDQLNFVFSIHAFDLIDKKNGECIESPAFKMKKNNGIQWILSVFPKGDDESTKDYLSIYLHLISEIPKLKVKANVKFHLQNDVNHEDADYEFSDVFTAE